MSLASPMTTKRHEPKRGGLARNQSGGDMVTCERCGPSTAASIAYRRGQSVFAFCRHCARTHDVKLRGIGYTRQSVEAMSHSG